MGLTLNYNVQEEKIYSAYGLTVYGKVNRYIWTIDNTEESALISLRITRMINGEETTVFDMQMGNRCVLQCRIDDTLDNFLYWMATENPDEYRIERQVYNSLCQSNSLFNYVVGQHKRARRYKD